ncbi:bestrophin-like domain [Paraburkholderia strydomiana]|uniref:bestrophin-like domain n=1 Tax=Paraburkholderia strydomiana TaxID=1245417 RepID=UPI0028619A00|nr:hypothetical protein [Paraburkholderia strydomiana]MDR7006229.1 hypothetical protein [Paraburkholderia strydomiana]
MSHLMVALLVFLLVSLSALFGLYVSTRLPEHHLSDDSMSAIKLSIGLVATIAALVLGLLISSAKNSFDAVNNNLIQNAANMIRLDSVLAQYGPETGPLRRTLKRNYADWIALIASNDATRDARLDSPAIIGRMEEFGRGIESLRAANDAQRDLKLRAGQIADDVFTARSLALLRREGTLPPALMFVLVCWLAVIFGTFGVLSPRNGTVIFAFLICALCASGAIFLILEMDTPLDGVVRVSTRAMREALERLGG